MKNKIPKDSFFTSRLILHILSPHFLATPKCKTEHIHWRKQSLTIKANRTEFAYVRFPTLNLETMSRELICCLWKKKISKLSMAGKEMLVSKKITQKYPYVKIIITKTIWRGNNKPKHYQWKVSSQNWNARLILGNGAKTK